MPEIPDMHVSIVNPGKAGEEPPKKRKRAKNVAKRKRDNKGRFKKGGGGSKPRKRNPSGGRSRAPARRRAASPARRRPRRRNPEGGNGGSAVSFRAIQAGILPAIAGRIAMAYAVRNWGDKWGTGVFGGGANTSPFAGQPWTFKNYAIGMVTAYVGGKILHRRNAKWGHNFFRGAVESMAERLLWTEGIGRSNWAQKNFGAQLMPAGAMGGAQLMPVGPMGAYPGAIMDNSGGNRNIMTPDGNWAAMMGQLVPQGDMGGLQPARAVDRQGRGEGGRRYEPYMGHALVSAANAEAVRKAARQGTGYTDSYASVYSYRG